MWSSGCIADTSDYHLPAVELVVRNAAACVWALPRPVRPLHVRSRLVATNGTPVRPWQDTRTMLPLALSGGATATIRAVVGWPPRGCSDCAVEVRVPALGWHATVAAGAALAPRQSR